MKKLFFTIIIILVVQLGILAHLSSASTITGAFDDETENTAEAETQRGNHQTNPMMMYTNPAEWAWMEYRKTTLAIVCIVVFSITLNFFFYLRYLINLANLNWRPVRVVRLQPTYEGEL